ncbi:glycosyltransferase family 2 protein [Tessaracoccus flavescens]|uniref:Glycosyltransferase 2-like domain-containing protein n=1 Tax=Tessaracoccus flavescens TaxID=399497 RepID=A0A1Q2CWI9_9ACTN|nr:glycosyltransferase [Tessaracoccus flavescens]AQP50488.1 hypothetical protein BW733_06230 [Tessaracoccus flavescens]
MTEVTVVIPTRNRSALLDTTLRSVQSAASEAVRGTRHGVRIVVVDDAPDNEDTRDLARQLGVDYLRVVEHDGRLDPGAAIKLGFSRIDTEFQTLFGDDDITLPRHFRSALDLIGEGADVVSNSFHITDSELNVTSTVILKPTGIRDIIAGHTRLNDGSFLRSSLIQGVELDVALEAHMLPPMWAHVMLSDARFAIVEEPTWLYRRHDTNISKAAYSERDRELRTRSNAAIRTLVLERLGHLPGDPPPYVAPKPAPPTEAAPSVAAETAPSVAAETAPAQRQDSELGAAGPETSVTPDEGSPDRSPAGHEPAPARPHTEGEPHTQDPAREAGHPEVARGLRYRLLNKAARILRRGSDAAIRLSRR